MAEVELATWAAKVAHDLKNPLTGITMSLEMAREDVAELDPEVGTGILALLDRAMRSADRLETMLEELTAEAREGVTRD